MALREILLLGDKRLYEKSTEIGENEKEIAVQVVRDLHDTIMDFKRQWGFGRAIAAPQIGEFRRIIYMYIDRPIVFLNPVLTFLDEETYELWDDCMSFPGLFVRVKRYKRCLIDYLNIDFKKEFMELEGDLSELIQHEYDHLDGILAVQRAIDNKSLAMKKAFK